MTPATYAAALGAVVCFAVVFRRLGVVAAARTAVETGLGAARVMRDPVMTDLEKERAVQAASLALARGFGSIAARSAAALGASLLPLLALQWMGLTRLSSVNGLLMSWNGILLASAAMTLVFFAKGRQ